MKWEDVPSGRLLDPKVELQDFLEAVQGVRPSVASAEIQKCHDWTKEFGSEGA